MTIRNKKPAISSPTLSLRYVAIFTTEQDKERQKKLEHKEHQRPTVVSWVIFILNNIFILLIFPFPSVIV